MSNANTGVCTTTKPVDEAKNSLIHSFIGTARWKTLFDAIRTSEAPPNAQSLGLLAIIIAVIVSTAPGVFTLLDTSPIHGSIPVATLAFGICAILAVLFRARLGIVYEVPMKLKDSLNLTHTAFALGCVPALLLLIFAPEHLATRYELFAEMSSPPAGFETQHIGILERLITICMIAIWIAVTEELIFRGLLVSVLRRWKLIKLQFRDGVAIVASAAIFGLCHAVIWGPVAAIALMGLGLGFALAYIATGERLLPVIIYHFAFDVLSISASIPW